MATQNCPTITITETIRDKAKVSCFVGEADAETGAYRPAILRADLLTEAKEINGVEGKEGELILISVDEKNSGELRKGDLVIITEDEDAENYGVENLDLTYNDRQE